MFVSTHKKVFKLLTSSQEKKIKAEAFDFGTDFKFRKNCHLYQEFMGICKDKDENTVIFYDLFTVRKETSTTLH